MTKHIDRIIGIEDLPEIPLWGVLSIDDSVAGAEALPEKLSDALTPGYQVEFDPDEAVRAGAFTEDALSEADAIASDVDLPLAQAK